MSRIVSFCFDDGFRASAETVWRLFAARDLSATFCVLAAPELAKDPFIRGAAIADWGFWREAQAAGHEVAPHGWAHERLGELPVPAACESLDRTLEAFVRELPDFELGQAIFHLPYLTAPTPVVQHLSSKVLGVRRKLHQQGLNRAFGHPRGASIDCVTFPDPADERLQARIGRFLGHEAGWLVLVLHGLDGEGWGPVSSDTLAAILDRLTASGVRVAPAGQVLRQGTTAS
ncbi:polysaccharide deacetylase family protein [Phenylobacterium terrae]|uniref:Chitooligosaccharide deacetylase n=1 Tax=Phenylobacterium terrae TaxID=2665495 RepID=A0ABW4N667_9CAUL